MQQALCVGKEYARVPVELAAVDEYLREVALRLLGERLHLVHAVLHLVAHLYISVARLGARRLQAEREHKPVVRHEVESAAYALGERLLADDGLVGGRDDDVGVGVVRNDAMRAPCYARRRAAMYRLCEQMVGRYVGQLLTHEVDIRVVGVHIYVLYRHNLLEAVVCLLKLSASAAEEVDELLRFALAAARPQSASLAAGKNHAVVIVRIVHAIVLLLDRCGLFST